jgi:hypothetical protein
LLAHFARRAWCTAIRRAAVVGVDLRIDARRVANQEPLWALQLAATVHTGFTLFTHLAGGTRGATVSRTAEVCILVWIDARVATNQKTFRTLERAITFKAGLALLANLARCPGRTAVRRAAVVRVLFGIHTGVAANQETFRTFQRAITLKTRFTGRALDAGCTGRAAVSGPAEVRVLLGIYAGVAANQEAFRTFQRAITLKARFAGGALDAGCTGRTAIRGAAVVRVFFWIHAGVVAGEQSRGAVEGAGACEALLTGRADFAGSPDRAAVGGSTEGFITERVDAGFSTRKQIRRARRGARTLEADRTCFTYGARSASTTIAARAVSAVFTRGRAAEIAVFQRVDAFAVAQQEFRGTGGFALAVVTHLTCVTSLIAIATVGGVSLKIDTLVTADNLPSSAAKVRALAVEAAFARLTSIATFTAIGRIRIHRSADITTQLLARVTTNITVARVAVAIATGQCLIGFAVTTGDSETRRKNK